MAVRGDRRDRHGDHVRPLLELPHAARPSACRTAAHVVRPHGTLFNAASCAGAPKTSPTVSTWNVAASVAIGQPAGPFPTRAAGSLNSIHLLDFPVTRGRRRTRSSTPGRRDRPGRRHLRPEREPRTWMPRARSVCRATTARASTWSSRAPSAATTPRRGGAGDREPVAPFDLSNIYFPDARGPSYQLRGTVREKAIAGSRVTVAAAKGKKGKRFRTLGKGKVNSQGVFKVRFRLSRGTYRSATRSAATRWSRRAPPTRSSRSAA